MIKLILPLSQLTMELPDKTINQMNSSFEDKVPSFQDNYNLDHLPIFVMKLGYLIKLFQIFQTKFLAKMKFLLIKSY